MTKRTYNRVAEFGGRFEAEYIETVDDDEVFATFPTWKIRVSDTGRGRRVSVAKYVHERAGQLK